MRLSLGNLCKIKFSIFNPIWIEYLHHNILNSTLEYDGESIFSQIELNIEISILQRFPRESLILNSLYVLLMLLKGPFFKMKDVCMHVFSIFMQ